MALPYIDTPRTEVDGNATFMTNAFRSGARNNLSALDSVENSFQSPSKDPDLVKTRDSNGKQKRNNLNFGTPRAVGASRSTRHVLQDRRNLPSASRPKGEFTPLMKSVTKNNFLRNTGGRDIPETPAILRDSYRSNENTPGLPKMEMTELYEDASIDSMIVDEQATPIPQMVSSSIQGTPLPMLPGRDGNGGILGDRQNMMTLREQENIINKLDKDNFGLKLKIHYLEEALKKSGPEFNQAALKENTELKVLRVTMQRDLQRCRKSLQQAERDLEGYRLQLQQLREKANRRHADEQMRKEMDWIREEMEVKKSLVNKLQKELSAVKEKESSEIDKLRDEINDLEFAVREKDRLIEEKEEEMESLKEKEGYESNAMAELEAELERARDQVEDLQNSLELANSDLEEAKKAQQEVVEEKEHAEENLRELQDEMSNKSFYTKGLSRQLEEKANKLEEELMRLRKEHAVLEEEFASKTRHGDRIQEQLEELQQELSSEKARMQDELELAQHERDIAKRERDVASSRLLQAEDEILSKGGEINLLRDRHGTLTSESADLQRDLNKAKSSIEELENQLDIERQQLLDNNHELRSHHKDEIDALDEVIRSLRHEIEDKDARFSDEHDKWESMRRSLEMQKSKAEQQAAGFKDTIEKLRDVEMSMSGREQKLQKIIDGEKERHLQEEALLNKQIKELSDDITTRRQAAEAQRLELLGVKEELRNTKREESSLKEKIQGLEDEVVIVQASLEEEQEYARSQRELTAADIETALQSAIRERQIVCDQLANANIELHNLRTSYTEIQAERDALQSLASRAKTRVDDTHRLDQEIVDLRTAKLRLEGDVNRMKEEKGFLMEAKDALRSDLDSEIERATREENRLSAEIDQLQDRLFKSSGKRDPELTSVKTKVQRLETRVRELEGFIEHQVTPSQDAVLTAPEISILRQSLSEAREKELACLQREKDLKASIRDLKARIASLERENHELQTKRITASSPGSSPFSSLKTQDELRALRSQLLDAHKAMKILRTRNSELERFTVGEEERKELHELLKTSTLEAESLALKLSERDVRVNELRHHLRRLREERALSVKKADSATQELEELQDRYDAAIDDMMQRSEGKGRHQKEIRGLAKEIMWLRAKLAREKQFRMDLAWSKGFMELGERIRVACNETGLKMIAEMGAQAPVLSKGVHDPRRKFRVVAFMVLSMVRMRKLSTEWRNARRLAEGLKKAKEDVVRRRANIGRKKSVES